MPSFDAGACRPVQFEDAQSAWVSVGAIGGSPVLRHGAQVKVVAPPALREMVTAELQAAVRMYQRGKDPV